jgi:glutaredoxin-like protein NrdH
MNITLYRKPGCVQCDATERALRSYKIPHETVDMTRDAEALEAVKKLGYRQAPVVITDTDAWSGFRPDKIKQLAPNREGGQVGLDSSIPRRLAL